MNFTPVSTTNTSDSQSVEFAEIEKFREKILSSKAPGDLKDKISININRIESVLKYGGNAAAVDVLATYVDWIVQLPWDTSTDDTFDLNTAKKTLDANHYGLDDVKQRVLEYLSVLSLQRQKNGVAMVHAPILLFVGLAGTGKTSFAASVAQTLGRKLVRIAFGGLSSGFDLRGMSKMNHEAEPGLIIKSLIQSQTNNPVILLDEIDRVAVESRGEIMGILLEMLDVEQNGRFLDHYIDYPFDLSKALFIATSNNTQNIGSAVLDRLEVIQMPTYQDEDKITIAKKYILPKLLNEVGLPEGSIVIDDAVWQHLARVSGYDPGIRSVERKIEMIVRRVAYRVVAHNESQFKITQSNSREFLDL